jgi:hypothetical protein
MAPSGQKPVAYETTGDMAVAARPRTISSPRSFAQSLPVSCRQVAGSMSLLPFPGTDAMPRHCLPAAFRLLSWVPWASVPHASGQRLPSAPRYCALLRLPSSFPVGSLLAPSRYLGLTRSSLCPSQLALRSVRPPAASAIGRQGVDYAGHPCSGSGSQGDGRLSRVPGLPL